MEIAIQLYLSINLFLAGYWFNENYKWEKLSYVILFSLVCLFFGVLGYLIYLLFILFLPFLRWVYKEIRFQYRFYFTTYWDKIFLDDNYSTLYKTREEKLERSAKLVKRASKQLQRHNRQIQKKYNKKLKMKVVFDIPIFKGDILSKDWKTCNSYIVNDNLELEILDNLNGETLEEGDLLELIAFELLEPLVKREQYYLIERIENANKNK